MKTILDILKLSSLFLEEKGVPAHRRQAEELIADVLGIGRMDLYLQFDRPLSEEEVKCCRERLKRKAAREPLQYIKGSVDFFDCSIEVDPSVLIPRQETELLVEKIVSDLEERELDGEQFWDICCGSGCIGIAIKKRFPQLKVILSDLSIRSLEVAQNNARKNDVEVECRCGDLFDPFKGEQARYVACNPPYISEKEFSLLEPEVRDFEPKGALVSGLTGLEFYERIAGGLSLFFLPSARLWLEMGSGQGEAVKHIFESVGAAKGLIEKDLAGHERFFLLEIE